MPTSDDEHAALAALTVEAEEAQRTERLGLPAEFGIRTLHPKEGDKRPLMVMFRMQASFPFAFEFVTADARFIRNVADTLLDLADSMLSNPDNAEYLGKEEFTEDTQERMINMTQNDLGMRTYSTPEAVEVATDSASTNTPEGEKVE